MARLLASVDRIDVNGCHQEKYVNFVSNGFTKRTKFKTRVPMPYNLY